VTRAAEALREAWELGGICRLPGFLSEEECGVYRQLCDAVLRQARTADPRFADSTNIAWLTQPRYWQDDRRGLIRLLELIAAPKAVGLIRSLTGEPPLFNNTQYFAEPVTKAWYGLWHRDCQFLAVDEGEEQATMTRFTGIHLHIALVADDSLSYVPGSHRRMDLPEERRIRRADDPDMRSNGTMPGAEVIRLGSGDAVLFNAWGIHRGRYDPARTRRTLDILYQTGDVCRAAPPPPTCFEDPSVTSGLSPAARSFFQYFVDSYAPFWADGRYVKPSP
jgi:hypothetical protein